MEKKPHPFFLTSIQPEVLPKMIQLLKICPPTGPGFSGDKVCRQTAAGANSGPYKGWKDKHVTDGMYSSHPAQPYI